MTAALTLPSLFSLERHPYLTPEGLVNPIASGCVGVYAISDAQNWIHYIGFSRDIYLSLRQHLVRQPQACEQFQFYAIQRPNRTELETIRQHWLSELTTPPPGNTTHQPAWEQPIDLKTTMTPAMQQTWQTLDPVAQTKFLKDLARQKETEIFQALAARQVTEPLRFNPKLKENGLLDLK